MPIPAALRRGLPGRPTQSESAEEAADSRERPGVSPARRKEGCGGRSGEAGKRRRGGPGGKPPGPVRAAGREGFGQEVGRGRGRPGGKRRVPGGLGGGSRERLGRQPAPHHLPCSSSAAAIPAPRRPRPRGETSAGWPPGDRPEGAEERGRRRPFSARSRPRSPLPRSLCACASLERPLLFRPGTPVRRILFSARRCFSAAPGRGRGTVNLVGRGFPRAPGP